MLYRNLANKSVIFGRTRFFYMPQSWDMGKGKEAVGETQTYMGG
jgi:hypothetical protein